MDDVRNVLDAGAVRVRMRSACTSTRATSTSRRKCAAACRRPRPPRPVGLGSGNAMTPRPTTEAPCCQGPAVPVHCRGARRRCWCIAGSSPCASANGRAAGPSPSIRHRHESILTAKPCTRTSAGHSNVHPKLDSLITYRYMARLASAHGSTGGGVLSMTMVSGATCSQT